MKNDAKRSKAEKSSKKALKLILLAIAVVAVIAAAAVVVPWLIRSETPNAEPASAETPVVSSEEPAALEEPEAVPEEPVLLSNEPAANASNILNGGRMLYDNGMIYYTKHDGIIYKLPIEADPSQKEEIYASPEGADICNINIQGSTLYFYESGKGICCIKMDSLDLSVLKKAKDFSKFTSLPKQMIVVEGAVFLRFEEGDKGRLFRVDLSSGKMKQITANNEICRGMTLYGEFIYYSITEYWWDGGSICKVQFDGTDRKELGGVGGTARNILFAESSRDFYFVSSDGWLSSGTLQGGGYYIGNRVSAGQHVCNYNLFGVNSDGAYYISGEQNQTLYTIKKYGQENTGVVIGKIDDEYGLYTIANWVYFIKDGAMNRITRDWTSKEVLNKM